MKRAILLSLACLSLTACAGSAGQDSIGAEPAPALDAWSAGQLAELRAMGVPAGVDPALWRAISERFEEFIIERAGKAVLEAPVSPASAPRLSLERASRTLSWGHSMQGDYSQDSEVGISDLTPLGQHFNKNSANGGPFPYNDVLALVDGDSNGQINISDISPIGAAFGRRCQAYNIYASPSFEDLPATPGGPNGAGAVLLGSVPFSAATGSAGQERLQFSFVLEEELGGQFIWLRPADGSSEGTPSNAVSFGSLPGNGLPQAALEASPLNGEAPLTVNFDASASFDFDGANGDISDILQFNWDFDGDGIVDLTSDSPLATHVYNNAGTFAARLFILDAAAGQDDETVSIGVAESGNAAPQSSFTADPTEGQAPLLVSFDDSATSDDGGAENLLYEWDFNGDGVFDLSTDSEAQVEQFYPGGGSFLVELRVTDVGGLSDSSQVALDISGEAVNELPVADLQADVTSGPVPLEVTFDFSGSSDPDGEIVLYELDVNADGVFDFTQPDGPDPVVHSYDTAGVFNALLKVTDDDGDFDSVQLLINADDGNNILPVVNFSFNPSLGDVPLLVSFDGSSSSDADGSIANYEWDFEGDGVFDLSGPEATVQHTYTFGGDFVPVLRVTDNEGGQNEGGFSLLFVSNPNNQAPLADLTITELSADYPQEYEFDASTSLDGDGSIATYSWDFDGDGTPDLRSSEAIVTRSFHEIRLITPSVTVIDNEGADSDPATDIDLDITSGWTVLELDQVNQSHGTAKMITTKSQEGINLNLAYSPDSDNDPLRFMTANFDQPGQWSEALEPLPAEICSSELTMLVSDGNPALVFRRELEGSGGEAELRFVRADNFAGTVWGSPVTIDSGTDSDDFDFLGARAFSGEPGVISVKGDVEVDFWKADNAVGSSWPETPVAVDETQFGIQAIGSEGIDLVVANSGVLRYYRASSNDGSGWHEPVVIDDEISDNSNSHRLGLQMVGGLLGVGYIDRDQHLSFARALNTSGTEWGAPVIVMEGIDSERALRDVSLGLREGRPVISCSTSSGLVYAEATDASGASWSELERPATFGSSFGGTSMIATSDAVMISFFRSIDSVHSINLAFRQF